MVKKRTVAAGWLALALAFIPVKEGVKLAAYRDPVGIPTACFGETRGVHMGQTYTLEQCKAMLVPRVEEFDAENQKCLIIALTPGQRAAAASFSYNLGSRAFCKGPAKLFNIGKPQAACDKFLEYNKAGGHVLPGLVKRRQEERELCLL